MDTEKLEQLVTKIDDFAETLDTEEQAVLAALLGAGDEVTGFSNSPGWPEGPKQISIVWGHAQSAYISIVWGHAQAPTATEAARSTSGSH